MRSLLPWLIPGLRARRLAPVWSRPILLRAFVLLRLSADFFEEIAKFALCVGLRYADEEEFGARSPIRCASFPTQRPPPH